MIYKPDCLYTKRNDKHKLLSDIQPLKELRTCKTVNNPLNRLAYNTPLENNRKYTQQNFIQMTAVTAKYTHRIYHIPQIITVKAAS
jgi:hypothetical protein